MSDEPPLITEEELDRLSHIGHAIYDEKLKAILEPEYNGQFVAIHLDTGDYEVGSRSSRPHFKLRDRHPEGGMIMVTDVGLADYDRLTMRMIASQLLTEQRK